jgi:hypothetical protein
MAKISTYSTDATLSYTDKLICTYAQDSNITKIYTIGSILSMPLPSVPVYANNTAAKAGGLVAGNIYRITGTDTAGVVW